MTHEKLELISQACSSVAAISALLGSCRDIHVVNPDELSMLLYTVEQDLRAALDID